MGAGLHQWAEQSEYRNITFNNDVEDLKRKLFAYCNNRDQSLLEPPAKAVYPAQRLLSSLAGWAGVAAGRV